MRKINLCGFCDKNINLSGHLTILALLHLEIEHYPEIDFGAEETYEKISALKRSVTAKSIHLNLSYAGTQLMNLQETAAAEISRSNNTDV